MHFASDNAGPAHPALWAALQRADAGYAAPYGADALTAQAQERLRSVFEAPEATVHLVATGSAANALALACMTRPFDTVFCSELAHIDHDECGAPSFFAGGAKLTPVTTRNGKICPDALTKELSAPRPVHVAQAGPVSLSNVTELGTVYSLDEITALTSIAHAHGSTVHLDGARFANALAALAVSPADMSWRTGVDALCFGGTKNGLLGVEAVLFFDPDLGREFELRRKRGGHLFSKMRYLSAQMLATLNEDLWLTTARMANENASRLAEALAATPQIRLLEPAEANMVFAEMPRALHRKLHEAGAVYVCNGPLDGPEDEMLSCRMVCDWSIGTHGLDDFITLLKAV